MALLHVSEADASIVYDVKLTVCKNGYIKTREYDKKIKKLKTGFESENKRVDPKAKKKDSEKEILKRSLNRTRDTLIEYASENALLFKSFITLTFSENEKDITAANREFHKWVTLMKRKYPNFVYLGVPEFQKRGAVHYHVLTSLRCGYEIQKMPVKRTYNKDKNKWFELEYYDIQYWNKGYSSAFDLNMADEKFNVALYITKYLYKDIDNRLWGHKKILKSNNLKEPNTYYLKKNSEVYQGAINYIKEKAVSVNEFTFTPKDSFQIGFQSLTTFISQSDCNSLKEFMQNEYKEMGVI